jgi:hypothetical protein
MRLLTVRALAGDNTRLRESQGHSPASQEVIMPCRGEKIEQPKIPAP